VALSPVACRCEESVVVVSCLRVCGGVVVFEWSCVVVLF
jgi:hypothetical protein